MGDDEPAYGSDTDTDEQTQYGGSEEKDGSDEDGDTEEGDEDEAELGQDETDPE